MSSSSIVDFGPFLGSSFTEAELSSSSSSSSFHKVDFLFLLIGLGLSSTKIFDASDDAVDSPFLSAILPVCALSVFS